MYHHFSCTTGVWWFRVKCVPLCHQFSCVTDVWWFRVTCVQLRYRCLVVQSHLCCQHLTIDLVIMYLSQNLRNLYVASCSDNTGFVFQRCPDQILAGFQAIMTNDFMFLLSVQESGLVIPHLDCDPFQFLSNLSFIVSTAIWNFMVSITL